MTDIETTMDRPPARDDAWGRWWFRLLQLGGLAGFTHELLISQQERKWILLVCVAMMLGGYGMGLIAKAITERLGGT